MKINTGDCAVYPLTSSQNTVLYQQKFALNKNVQNIPFYFVTEKVIDFDIMKKAVKEEIARNDSMRLRIFKKGKDIFQYFPKTVEIEDIPVYDFKSKSEQDEVLGNIAVTPLKPYKNQFYRIILFKTENKYGVFILAHHVCLDGMGVNIFFKDLCNVYDSLAEGKPMPKPMASFEEFIKRELAIDNDMEKKRKDREYLAELMRAEGEPIYAGAQGYKHLERLRKKKKNPTMRTVPMFDPIHEKTDEFRGEVSPELMNNVRDACKTYGVTPLEFVSCAMRLYLSAINKNCNDVTTYDTVCRRATAASRNMGGCLVHAPYVRTVFSDDEQFFEFTQELAKRYMQIYKHADYDTLDLLDLAQEVWGNKPGNDYIAYIFAYMPLMSIPEDTWHREYDGYNSGAFSHVMYISFSENPQTGSLHCVYSYRKNIFSAEDIRNFFEQMVIILEKAAEDPTLTVGELKKAITIKTDD